MKLNYNRTGAERKALVQAISAATGQDSVYQGAATFAYTVGDFHIDKAGIVSGPFVSPELWAQMRDTLAGQDIHGEELPEDVAETPAGAGALANEEAPAGQEAPIAEESTPPEEPAPALPTAPRTSGEQSAVEFKNAGFDEASLFNLDKLIASKAGLFKKAFGADSLDYIPSDDNNTLTFPWFKPDATREEINAYSLFIAALCKMAKELKRVTATAKDVDNEKYAFRCFLLRLGFIGAEYKEARKILLANMAGNGSFKSGAPSITDNEEESNG